MGPYSWLDWTGGIDLCFPNEDEACLLGGEGSSEANACRLTDVYGEVVVKLGSAGAVWCNRRGDTLAVPAGDAEIVDTTGAGDAFCAGFLAGWLRGASPEANLQAAVALSSVVVSQVGGRPLP